jgi:hypothetical protein
MFKLILLPALSVFAATSAVQPAAAQPAAVAETAAAVAKRCGASSQAKAQACYVEAMEGRLAGGPAPALELLGQLAAIDPDVRRDGHMYAHRIGIAALTSTADVSTVFASCTPAWQSGCYHGVIQSYFLLTERAGGSIERASVDALCGDYRGTRADLLFQCTHGMGHGLVMLNRYDLPKALIGCDLLSRPYEQEMCHAGAFMENVVNATHPHAPAPKEKAAEAGHGGHGAHGDHGGDHGGNHGAAPAVAFKAIDPEDWHYPCSIAGERYLIGCYTIQTSAMLHHAKGDLGKVAAECGRAPEKARATCFLSLGRDVSTLAAGKDSEAIRLCGLAEARYRPACHRGVVESIVNMNADPSEGIAYCTAVPEAPGKRACYSAIGLQALVLPDGEAKRAKACARAEAAMRDVCLNRAPAPAPVDGD